MEDFAVSGPTAIDDCGLIEDGGEKRNDPSSMPDKRRAPVADSRYCVSLLSPHLIVDPQWLLVLRPQSPQSEVRSR
jgi:hypothetical protein